MDRNPQNPTQKAIKEAYLKVLAAESPHMREERLQEIAKSDPRLAKEVDALLKATPRGDAIEKVFRFGPIPVEDDPADATSQTIDPLLEKSNAAIGPYRLLQPIGEGGMGTVFLAQQTEPIQRKVALKIIKLGMDTAQVVARFNVERQALALMDHPNIARVLDAGSTDQGRPYFVMELVEGKPITDYCSEHKLSIRERLKLFMRLCHGVQHAHQKGIIHRDLKPGNVLVKIQDGEPIVKIIDFGIAKALHHDLIDNTRVTTEAQWIGTPLYMSPEQATRNGIDVDTRSDIYSLGVMLYELLTGSTPFDRDTLNKVGIEEIRRMIRETDPPRPSLRLSTVRGKGDPTRPNNPAATSNRSWKELQGELDWIVMKSLAKDRDDRYESASAFAADILRFLNHEPVLASPPSFVYRMRKMAWRNKAILATSLAILSILVTATAFSLWQAMQTFNAKDDLQAFSDFLVYGVLSSARPEGVQKGQGVDVTVAQALSLAEKDMEKYFEGRPVAEAIVRDAIGKTWRNLAKYSEAETQLKRAVEIRTKELGPNHRRTLDSCNSLATVYMHQDRADEAIALLKNSIARLEATKQLESAENIIILTNYATILSASGQPKEAIHTLERAWNIAKSVLGPEDPETLLTRTNLATAYYSADTSNAESFMHDTLEQVTRCLGEGHTYTLLAMNSYAEILSQKGDRTRAIEIFIVTIDKMKRACGPLHDDTLSVISNLAGCYLDDGKLHEAESLSKEVFEGRMKVLGDRHRLTQSARKQLAKVLTRQGKFAEAIPLYEEALPFEEQRRNQQDSILLATARDLFLCYRDANRYKEVEPIADIWLPRSIDTLGLDDSNTREWAESAVALYDNLGQWAKAEPLHEMLAAHLKTRDSVPSQALAYRLESWGRNLLSQQKYEEAITVYRECLSIMEVTGPNEITTSKR